MNKVMLVDDEKLIVQGLMSILEWDKLDLKVVQTAENGEDALNKFKENPVDIVITDINMPKVTGLELIKKIKEVNSKVKFIILSGYDEFSYARTALQYGVESYILKPINEEELEEELIKIIDAIKSEKRKEDKVLEKNIMIDEFIRGKISIEKFNELKDSINLDFNDKCYTVSSITINRKENQNNKLTINDIIDNNTSEKYELIKKYDGQTIIINSWEKDIKKEEILDYYNNLKDRIIESLKVDAFILIGTRVENICDLKDSYIVARKLKKYILVEGTNICLSEEYVKTIEEKNRDFTEEIDKIHKLIIEKNNSKLEDYITQVFDDNKLTAKNIYDLSIKIIVLTGRIADEFKLDSKYSRDSLSDTIVELCNESTRDNVKRFLINEVEELIELISVNIIKYSPVIQQIINTVNDRYYEELSLKTLAQQYNINSSYLGQVFAKEVGVSFSEYLNKTKNMKAKEFILNTNMKINDIAKAVGYLDTSYFYRKFKKYYGVCPSTLRELKNY